MQHARLVRPRVYLIHAYFWLKLPFLPHNYCHIHLINAKFIAVSTDYFCFTFRAKNAKVAAATDFKIVNLEVAWNLKIDNIDP